LVSSASKDELKISDGDQLHFTIAGSSYALPVKLNDALPKGVAGLPSGLDGISFATLPAWGHVKDAKAMENVSLASEKNSVMK
jgi:hypothetical protein